jgi:small subunit ribosomal protein S7e
MPKESTTHAERTTKRGTQGARTKLKKSARYSPLPLEDEVAQAIFDIELSHTSLKGNLQHLYINTAKEVEVGAKIALVIFYPLRFIHKFRKIHKQLVAELEKKFSGKHVVFIAQRKIARKQKQSSAKIPRTRTMTAVHDAILTDIVFPFDIVGRRWRYKVDGSKHTKIFFDAREKEKAESKVQAFSVIYKKLTNKDVSFGYMTNPILQQFL